MDRSNVDTDQIIPKQFLKRIERTGFGQFLFFDWRFDRSGKKPAFRVEPARICRGFGSGRKAEFCQWQQPRTRRLGFGRLRISNSYRRVICRHLLQQLFQKRRVANSLADAKRAKTILPCAAATRRSTSCTIDLDQQTVSDDFGLHRNRSKSMPFRRHCLLHGLDDIEPDARKRRQDHGVRSRPGIFTGRR